MKCNSKLALALAIPVVIACAGSGSITSAPVTVHGIVRDSLSARVIGGATVSIAGLSAITDTLGAFLISNVPTGTQTVLVIAPTFEIFSRKLSFSSDAQHDIALRRLRPFVKDFAVSNTIISATFVDLQGAGTLDIEFSFVTIAPGPIGPRPLVFVTKTQLDPFSIRVSLDALRTGVTETSWVARDFGGNVGQFICTTRSCVEIFSF